MKKSKIILFTLLVCGVMTAAWVLYLLPHDSRSNSNQSDITDRLNSRENYGSVELGSRSFQAITESSIKGMFTAVQTVDVSDDTTEKNDAGQQVATKPRDHTSGVGALRREELMAEANRIMSDLYRAGVLTRPVCFACVFDDPSPPTDKVTIIIERFRRMHQMHLALVARALTFSDQDSLTISGWSQIRFDLAKLQKMADELRNETALAAR